MRVLIVEDERPLREGLMDLLSAQGYEPRAVDDGLAAAELAVAEPFDLVILDLALPRLGGLEVCRRIRTARPAAPILMLTARGGEQDKVRGLESGADDYVTKPFSARELLARVGALLRRAAVASAEPERLEVD